MSAPIDGAELATTTKPLESMLTGYLPPRGVINPLLCDADVSGSEIAGSGCSLAWSALKNFRGNRKPQENTKKPRGRSKAFSFMCSPTGEKRFVVDGSRIKRSKSV